MTDQELTARLRDGCNLQQSDGEHAADRIEELVKERDDLGRKLNTARYGQLDFAWSIHVEAMADLRAKLAKAAEEMRWALPILEKYIDDPNRIWVMDDFRATLAELDGEE